MTTIAEIERALAARRPALLPPGERRAAAVALLLRTGTTGPEVLFIERARRDGDPWSGDLGFPGGKIEDGDGGPRRAAERETREEVGLDLTAARCLGRLDDIAGAHLPVTVSCFVYHVAGDPGPLSAEVQRTFWFPLAEILDPVRHIETTVDFRGRRMVRPAIRLLGPGRTVLWGITYRLVRQFLERLGHELAAGGGRAATPPPPGPP